MQKTLTQSHSERMKTLCSLCLCGNNILFLTDMTLPERLIWAVEILAVKPADRVLEIGCGTGVAVSLICEKLTTGQITAIDRSETMIRKAEQKNREYIASGRAVFQTAALSDAAFGAKHFDKVFAVNVNLFWQSAEAELHSIRKLLAPKGTLYLFNQPPSADKAKDIARRTADALSDAGFAVYDVLFHDAKPAPVVCVQAAPM